MAFRQTQRKKTAKHVAAKGGKTKVLEKVCEWAREAISNVKNKLFLEQDKDGHIDWHLAGKSARQREGEYMVLG